MAVAASKSVDVFEETLRILQVWCISVKSTRMIQLPLIPETSLASTENPDADIQSRSLANPRFAAKIPTQEGGSPDQLQVLLLPEKEDTPLVSAVYSEEHALFDHVLGTTNRLLGDELDGSTVRVIGVPLGVRVGTACNKCVFSSAVSLSSCLWHEYWRIYSADFVRRRVD